MTRESKKPLVSKSTLIIRLIAGMYLLYLAYELFMGLNATDGAPVMVSLAAAIGFAIIGLILVFFSGKDFIKGNFEGGIMDVSGMENENKPNLEDTIDEK